MNRLICGTALALLAIVMPMHPSIAQFMPDVPRPATIPPEWLANPAPVVLKGSMPNPDWYKNKKAPSTILGGPWDSLERWVTSPPNADQAEIDSFVNWRARQKKELNHQDVVTDAMTLIRAHRFGKAMAEINAQLRKWPQSPVSYWQRGILYAYFGLDELALKDFDAAIHWANAAQNYGRPASWTGFSYSIYGQEIELYAHANRAVSLSRLNRAAEALSALDRAHWLAKVSFYKEKPSPSRDLMLRIAGQAVAKTAYGWSDKIKYAVDSSINSRVNECGPVPPQWAVAEKVGYRKVDVALQKIRLHRLCQNFAAAIPEFAKVGDTFTRKFTEQPVEPYRDELIDFHIERIQANSGIGAWEPVLDSWVNVLELTKGKRLSRYHAYLPVADLTLIQARSGGRTVNVALESRLGTLVKTGLADKASYEALKARTARIKICNGQSKQIAVVQHYFEDGQTGRTLSEWEGVDPGNCTKEVEANPKYRYSFAISAGGLSGERALICMSGIGSLIGIAEKCDQAIWGQGYLWEGIYVPLEAGKTHAFTVK